MKTGLYLITGEVYNGEDACYTPQSFMVSFPERKSDYLWNYDIFAEVKWEKRLKNGAVTKFAYCTKIREDFVLPMRFYCTLFIRKLPKKLISSQPQKIWSDSAANLHTNDSVTVELYKNGTLYDTVVLNRNNNWNYKWEKLSGGASRTTVRCVRESKFK